MIKIVFKSRLRGRALLVVLLALCCLEGLYLKHLWEKAAKPELGFLLKVGSSFVVAWRDPDFGFESKVFPSLEDAMGRVDGLGLNLAIRGNTTLEYMSLKDRHGKFVLHWKTFEMRQLNRMTFNSEREAVYFANAIRRGAYTPSPFGHSVFLARK